MLLGGSRKARCHGIVGGGGHGIVGGGHGIGGGGGARYCGGGGGGHGIEGFIV